AARISREVPGRAMARTEQGRVVTFQAATVSDDREGDARGIAGEEAVVRPFVGGPRPAVTDPEPTTSPASADSGGRLAAIVELLQAAASAAGCAAPRRPWLDPLPPKVSLDDLRQLGGGAAAPIGLADDPDHQCRHVYGW